MRRIDDALPGEILLMRQWLREVFQEATRGLPWPSQMGLLAVEQAIAAGMFGGLLTSAWVIEELQRKAQAQGAPGIDLQRITAALEQAALGPLPAQLAEWTRLLEQWHGGGPKPPRASGV